jgi:hypothetical protein
MRGVHDIADVAGEGFEVALGHGVLHLMRPLYQGDGYVASANYAWLTCAQRMSAS